MAKILGLPKLSPTMDQGTLVRWVKKEGETVEMDDLLAEIETDKATMEFRSFDRGVLLKRLAPEGATLAPDEPVAIIGSAGEDVTALVAEAMKAKAAVAIPVTAAAAPAATGFPVPSAPAAASGTAPAPRRVHEGRVPASPLVRKLARERGVDLTAVSGSGPHGRIVKRDLDALGGQGAGPIGVRVAPRVVPLSSMRRTIARRLTESKQQVPHFYLTIDVDAEPLVSARAQINAELEASGEKVSLNDLVIKACALALRRVPEANASFAGDAIHFHGNVDISVAVAIADGLMTPVVRDADRKSIAAIAREVRELTARAKDKRLKPEEMQNGTFSVSNLGMFGIEDFSAVINPPEGAILAVGAVRDEPVVSNGLVVPGKRMRMTMSCDHRVIDGALGARWLAALRVLLEQPVRMLV